MDALVLGYPVIDLEPPRAHLGSRLALLGEEPDPALLDAMCLHRHVTAGAPPVFLFHTANDGPVPVGNTLAYAAACEAAGVPFSCHVYEDGPHGVGLASDHPEAHLWFPAAAAFLGRHLEAADPDGADSASGLPSSDVPSAGGGLKATVEPARGP